MAKKPKDVEVKRRVRRRGRTASAHAPGAVPLERNGDPAGSRGRRALTKSEEVEQALRESEERFRCTFEQAAVGMVHIAPHGRFLRANRRFCELVGYTADELGLVTSMDITHPDDLAADLEYARRVWAGQIQEYALEKRYLRKDGTGVWANVTVSLVTEPGGALKYCVGVIEDITARKEAEETLREGEERFRALFEGSLDAIFLADPESGTILDANPAASELLLRSKEAMVGMHYTQLHPARVRSYAEEQFAAGVLDRQVHPTEVPVLCSDGSEKPVEILAQLIQISGVPVYLGTFRDISERKRTEAVLYESLETSKVLLNAIQDLSMLVDIRGCIVKCNEAMARRFGRRQEEMVGLAVADLLPADLAEQRRQHFERILASRETVRFEDQRDGRWFDNILTPVFDEQGKVVKVAVLARDITARRASENALRESEEMYRTFVRTSPDALVVAAIDGRIMEVSQRWVDMVGCDSAEEILGRTGFEFMVPEDHEKARRNIQKTILEGYTRDQEYTLVRKDGTRFIGELSAVALKDGYGEPRALVISTRDVTRERSISEELLKAQKLEALGVLAGGIAHDFNNLLTGILANISMARMQGEPGYETAAVLADAEAAAWRAKGLTEQLLTFARGGMPVRRTASVGRLLKDTTGFALSGSNLGCEYYLPEDLWPVDIDEGQISRVVQNLVLNAKQAMPEGGLIRVRAQNLLLPQGGAIPLKPGRYVRISLEDRGTGIPAKHLPRIFDPFFTTKDQGRGLGLAICFSIVKNHGGHIQVDSEVGIGTTFHVYLPASAGTLGSKELPGNRPLPGQGRVLVIDDEELVRRSLAKVLGRLGYEVEETREGREGIEVYTRAMRAGKPFAVVIADLTIPGGMGGRQVVQDLLKIDPQARVIASSGYSHDAAMNDFREYGFSGVLAKPYTIQQLGRVLHEVLAEGAGSAGQ